MHTPQSHLFREAVTHESGAGRYVHITPRQLPCECLHGFDALAKQRAERDRVSGIATELHRDQKAA
jgi:hypothetical protein